MVLFNDDIHDAIISQSQPLAAGSTTLYSFVSNVDHARTRGVELSLDTTGLGINGLEFSGSVTYPDAKTLATSGFAGASPTATSPIGKRLPNIPEWRGTAQLTYRTVPRVSLTTSARCSSLLYPPLDNADINTNTYQTSGDWFVADAHATA